MRSLHVIGVIVLVAVPVVFTALVSPAPVEEGSGLKYAVLASAEPARAEAPALPESLPFPEVENTQPPSVPRVLGRRATVNEALFAAAQRLDQWDIYQRQFMRYVWVRSGENDDWLALCLTLQHLSTAASILPPTKIQSGNLLLAEVDVRNFSADWYRQEFIDTWEELRFEPALNISLTKDTLKFNFGVQSVKQRRKVVKDGDWEKEARDVPPYVQDGKTYTKKWFRQQIVTYEEVDALQTDGVIAQLNVPAVDLTLASFLACYTHSYAYLITDGYFTARALRQVQDGEDRTDQVYRTLYGGLYYRFKCIEQGVGKGKVTDEDVLFEDRLGIGNTKEGITIEDVFDSLYRKSKGRFSSDARIFIGRSGVTDRERLVEFYPALPANVRRNRNLFTRTRDIARKNIDIGGSPRMNLLRPKDDGREGIFVDANGFPTCYAADGKGNILDAVPDKLIAGDRSTPHNTVLEPVISCLRCHATDAWYRKVKNDITLLTGGRFDILADFSRVARLDPVRFGSSNYDARRIFELYNDDPSVELVLLPGVRNELANAYLRATGGIGKSPLQLNIVQEGSALVARVFDRYVFEPVSAVDALRDLGQPVDGFKVLGALVPDTKLCGEHLSRILSPVPQAGGLADPRVGTLEQGGTLQRSEYDLIQGQLLARLMQPKSN